MFILTIVDNNSGEILDEGEFNTLVEAKEEGTDTGYLNSTASISGTESYFMIINEGLGWV